MTNKRILTLISLLVVSFLLMGAGCEIFPPKPVEYLSTDALDNPTVSVAWGTSEDEAIAALDATVGVVGSEDEIGTAEIDWTIAGYGSAIGGDDYEATGVLTLPENWVGDPGDVFATVTVTEAPVTIVAVTGVTLDQETLALVAEGATGTLVETVEPPDATDPSVTWASSAPAVATVDAGIVTPVAEGTATITVTTVDGDFTAKCTVTVSEFVVELVGIEVDPEEMTLYLIDDTASFEVTANYNDGDPVVVTSGCDYGVDDISIVTIDKENSKITADAVGSTNISISYTEGDITKETTLPVIVKGTHTIRWLEDAVRYNPDDSIKQEWVNCPIPSKDYHVPTEPPATLIPFYGGYYFDDVAFVYNYYPLPDLEGGVVIDETGQLSGHTAYTLYELPTTNDFAGQVEIIIDGKINWEVVDPETGGYEDYDSIMVGTYTQWKYVKGTEAQVLKGEGIDGFGGYPNAVLAPEQGPEWWFVGKTIYTTHGGE